MTLATTLLVLVLVLVLVPFCDSRMEEAMAKLGTTFVEGEGEAVDASNMEE